MCLVQGDDVLQWIYPGSDNYRAGDDYEVIVLPVNVQVRATVDVNGPEHVA